MQGTPRPAELALPVASLAAMRRSLAASVGADQAARALQAAGVAAGDALFRMLTHVPGGGAPAQPAEWSEPVFWRRVAELFERRGWGHLTQQLIHPGIGALESPNWVEADPEIAAHRPTCFFSAGLLANLLGRASGEDVSVLEVQCRSQGDERCRFLFGSPVVLDAVYGHLRAGADVDGAIAALG
ncbi:MAG: hypothetical protein L0271_17635 [Gemmatimonadetes bacterium]|nr:hypothetical protein [Gemmatimonadota bacterium]